MIFAPPLSMSSFSKQMYVCGSPYESFQSLQQSLLLGSQLRLIPPFVLLKIKLSALKSPYPHQAINNDGSPNKERIMHH